MGTLERERSVCAAEVGMGPLQPHAVYSMGGPHGRISGGAREWGNGLSLDECIELTQLRQAYAPRQQGGGPSGYPNLT